MNRALKGQFSAAFDSYAQEGIGLFRARTPDSAPVLSHICFKFTDMAAYAEYVAAARDEGAVIKREFKGVEISWCRLARPLEKGGVRLEWLELVEPRQETSPFTGVANLCYSVPALTTVEKIGSADKGMVFRYQARHAAAMAVSPG